MQVALVQFSAGLDKGDNVEALSAHVRSAAGADLIVCPEASMYTFGVDGGADIRANAEPLDGPFVARLSELAKETRAVIMAGMFEAGAPDDRAYNSIVVVGPDGDFQGAYRKIHLYDSFGFRESDTLAPGEPDPFVFSVEEHRVGVMTCYDLRFPELARLLADRDADLFAIPTAWVQGPLKEDHWATLVRARAIENTVYIAAAAQSGKAYCGRSMLVDPLGVIVTSLGEQDGVCTGEVRRDRIESVRRVNPALGHRRFRIEAGRP